MIIDLYSICHEIKLQHRLSRVIRDSRIDLFYLTRVIAGVPLTHTLENVVQPKYVPHLMDHCVLVALCTKVGRVENHPTYAREKKCRTEKNSWKASPPNYSVFQMQQNYKKIN